MSALSEKIVSMREAIAVACQVYRTDGYTPAERESRQWSRYGFDRHRNRFLGSLKDRNNNSCKIQDHFYGVKPRTVSAEDYKTADEIIEFFAGLGLKMIERELSDWEKRILGFIASDEVKIFESGQVAVLPKILNESKESDAWFEEESRLAENSEYIGETRTRIQVSIVPQFLKYIPSSDCTFVAGLANSKDIVKCYVPKWCYTPKIGQRITINGMVKSHEVSKLTNAKQTKVAKVTNVTK